MNSTTSKEKEARSVGKAHKKAQRNKKQQQQQQQQQQAARKQENCKKNVTTTTGIKTKLTATTTTTTTTAAAATTTTTTTTTKQCNNIKHNNNNNINNNNNNIAAKLREHLEAERQKKAQNSNDEHIKFERAQSFSLKGRLSKLFNSMTGSKENVSRVTNENDHDELPQQFTRSRSMILLRRPNRRSFIEPQLEQLSEEVEKSSDSALSPAKTMEDVTMTMSTQNLSDINTPTITLPITPITTTQVTLPIETTTTAAATTTTTTTTTTRGKTKTLSPIITLRQNSVPAIYNNETGSLLSLTSGKDTPDCSSSINPQLNFQRRRSNTLIGSFRSTLAGIIGGNEPEQQQRKKKKDKLNPKWSASLQSLQAIDNMVSYDNMSFIDYDKLNAYEKHLETQLSILNLNETIQPLVTPTIGTQYAGMVSLYGSNHSFNMPTPTPIPTPTTLTYSENDNNNNNMNGTCQLILPIENFSTGEIVRRRHKSLSNQSISEVNVNQSVHEARASFNLDTDYEHNYDISRNVYRDSLDSRKLELINEFMQNPYAYNEHIVDVLNLEVERPLKRRASICSASLSLAEDRYVDPHLTALLQIKSKSLTHLDGLDSTVAYQHGDKSANGAAPLSQNIVSGSNTINAATLAAGRLNHTESGSEYFQISFCLEPNCMDDDELIPIKKGMKLSNALNPALKKRNLSFSKIAIIDNSAIDFVEKDNALRSLDKNTSVERLAGHHLIVTQRDNNRKSTLQKAASFGARSRPARLLSSASTEETSEPAPSGGSKVKHRWSSLFGARNAQYAQLCDLLNTFSRTGVPQQPETILYLDHSNFADAMQYLCNMHSSWTDFIDYEHMSDNDKRIQTAIWELVTTEVYYIQTLQTVTNLFLACLLSVQEHNILKDVDQNKLFSNVREICFANLRFWTTSLYPMVAHSVATREPMRIVFFQQGFASFGALFGPYKRYCAEQSTCQYYCKELYRTNVLFTSYLAWCESHKMCNRLRLADILVRPMQRLTKYSLLLTAIRKQLYSMQEVELIDFMIQSVENFVCSVNSHLTIRQEHERLKGVMARIESYDVVPETNNEHLDRMLRQFSRMFDLCMPMKGCPAHHVRHLFMEGDHKYKDYTGKIDVHCFLMTDMLIVCKPASKKTVGQLRVIRQPYITDRLVVHLQNNILSCVYLNEYQVAVSAFTLTSLEARSWYDSLKRARNIYTRLKQSVLNMTPGNLPPGTAPGPYATEYVPYAAPYVYPHMYASSNVTGGVAATILHAGLGITDNMPNVSGMPTSTFDGNLGVSSNDPMSMLLRKSPMSSSSVCSHISSTNASKSGSVEWNESRNVSVEMEKTNSLSSDEGAATGGAHGVMAALIKGKNLLTGHKSKVPTTTTSSNRLSLQPPVIGHLGQSLPNLTTHQSHTNNTLLVPGTSSTHSGNLLLSPSHRGISYPPPSPTRVPLRRGLAFSTSMKNPPLVKTRNITSQNSFSWRNMFSSSTQATTTTTAAAASAVNTAVIGAAATNTTNPPSPTIQATGGGGGAGGIFAESLKPTATTLLLTNDDIAEETVEHLMHD